MTPSRHDAMEQLKLLDPAGPEDDRSQPSGGPEEILARILTTAGNECTGEEAATSPAALTQPVPMVATHRSRSKWWMAGTAVAAVAAALALVVAALPGSSTGNGRAAAHAGAPARPRPAPPWQLAATLQGAQFQMQFQMASGTPSAIAGIHCYGQGLCFLNTGYSLDTNQGGAVSVSHDGGHAWSPVTLPPDTAPTTVISCPTTQWCAMGAGKLDPGTGDPEAHKPARDPELLVSTNQGASWSVQSVPLPVTTQQLPATQQFAAETVKYPGAVDGLVCQAAGHCAIIGQQHTQGLTFMATTDGGAHWTSTALPQPQGQSAYQYPWAAGATVSMSCPSALDCVVVGNPSLLVSRSVIDVWRTTDGGSSWKEAAITGVNKVSGPVQCPTATVCWLGVEGALLRSSDGGATWSPVPLPFNKVTLPGDPSVSVPPTLVASCPGAETCWAVGRGIWLTTDAGQQWQPASYPGRGTGQKPAPDGPLVSQISCNAAQSCVAVATPAALAGVAANWDSLVLTNTPTS